MKAKKILLMVIPKLSKQNIHLWHIDLEYEKNQLQNYYNLLSLEEQKKSNTFKFIKGQNQFIISRGILKILSAAYLNIDIENIVFKYGKYGKPDYAFNSNLKFNISHSGNLAIIGFVRYFDIGADIENIKYKFNILDISNNFFSNLEIESLKKLPTEKQTKGFYRCWTRKESFIKAKAKGLSFPLDSFSVSIDSDEKAELLETKWDKKEKELWKLFSFSPKENYIGAVSVKGKIQSIKNFNFNEF